jgi:hypothetical protein
VHLIESILLPSKVIKKGFETVVITTHAEKTFTGLVAEERGDANILRDSVQDGKLITILKKDIDEPPFGTLAANEWRRQQYLDPAYRPTTIVPGTGKTVLQSGGARRRIITSAAATSCCARRRAGSCW